MKKHRSAEQVAKEFEEATATTQAIAIKVAHAIDKCNMCHSIPALCFVLATMGEDIIDAGEMDKYDFLEHINCTINDVLAFRKENTQ